MWMLNTNLAVGSVVKMRMQIMLPASSPFVNLHGESSHVRKICRKGLASADVLAWQVLAVEDSLNFNVKVRLAAVEFSHNNSKVALTVAAPVVLTVDNVQRQKWSYQCLWVMRGVRRCMHCHQRWRAMQSFDVQQTNHGVLCTQCLDLLYARESQLSRRWRLRAIDLPREKVPRVHSSRGPGRRTHKRFVADHETFGGARGEAARWVACARGPAVWKWDLEGLDPISRHLEPVRPVCGTGIN